MLLTRVPAGSPGGRQGVGTKSACRKDDNSRRVWKVVVKGGGLLGPFETDRSTVG